LRILVTGNLGYVGSVLVPYLRARFPTCHLIGFDRGYFAHLLTGAHFAPEILLNEQHYGDIRKFPYTLLQGVDFVIHLAALSNDPMGNEFDSETLEINYLSSVKLALSASEQNVKGFIFASSCSVYGLADKGSRNEQSQTSPLTHYARSKVLTERELQAANLDSMQCTCLRFATACGMSDRLRLDLVLNDFVASAITVNEITVLSDGTPWRPLIDVEDMCRAIDWAISREFSYENQFLSINVGSNDSNYQVIDLAQAVAHRVDKAKISLNSNAPNDSRSYKVDFSLFAKLAPGAIQCSLDQTIDNLIEGLDRMKFNDINFRSSNLIRLNAIRKKSNSLAFRD
jgi:nucleoside-diphosphate-sugar epimerase